MLSRPIIKHIYPKSGGIYDYSQVIDRVYRSQGFTVQTLIVKDDHPIAIKSITSTDNAIYHIELGVNDNHLFWLSWKLSRSSRNKVIVTIHDPGKVVHNLSNIKIPANAGKLISITIGAIRKPINAILRRYLMPKWHSGSIIPIYLNKRDAVRGYYLPHPTYTQKPAVKSNVTKKSETIKLGFSGYWGKWKGMDELIHACENISKVSNIKLIIAGKTVHDNDSYQKHIEQIATQQSFIELPGFIEQNLFTQFLSSLDVLVLPYYLDIPGGISGMAQRVAELAVPVIATKTPALIGQIGAENAIFVEPANTSSLQKGIEEYIQNKRQYDLRAINIQKEIYETNGWSVVGSMLGAIINEATTNE